MDRRQSELFQTRVTTHGKRFRFHDDERLDWDDLRIYFINCVLQVQNCLVYSIFVLQWTTGEFLEKYFFLCLFSCNSVTILQNTSKFTGNYIILRGYIAFSSPGKSPDTNL